jgi:SAM-dependent methyltransferase
MTECLVGPPVSSFAPVASHMPYDQPFFDYVNFGATRSAGVVLPLLYDVLPVRSVLDVGCGAGAWLAAWRQLGVDDVVGLDGNYVERSRLLIPPECFRPTDLVGPFDCGRRFDLAQSVEVAEHLPDSSADGFVAALVRHADAVLFSAAVPGQGGDHHVNEQPYGYWRQRFARHGYTAIDYLRPLLFRSTEVEPWYCYNLFLYVRGDTLPALPEALRASVVPDDKPLPDVSPMTCRMRRALVRQLPVPAATAIAKLKERVVVRWRQPRDLRK